MQTPAPPSMKPGAVSVEGAGRAPGSFGTRDPGSDLAGPVPDDTGANVFFPGGMSPGINEVTDYNGATPPPAGGGGKAMRNVKAV